MRIITTIGAWIMAWSVVAQSHVVNNGSQWVSDTATYQMIDADFANKAGGTVKNSGTIQLTGDLDNGGNFDQTAGKVIFNGSAIQEIRGDSVIFYLVEIDNSLGAGIVSGSHGVRHTFEITSGTFKTNDSLILLSDSTLTGRIAEIPFGGNVVGHITMERYLDNGVTGWHMIGTATSGGNLQEWYDDFITSGFTGSHFPSFSFNNIFTYTESDTGQKAWGYHGASNITDTINSGQGFWAYIGPVPLTLDTKGPAHTFGQALPVTYTNNLDATHDGWNLVANPYPSNINWNATGWTKLNIDNAIYIYDPDNGVYTSYVSGVGTNGGTPYIASSQSFWVKASASTPILTLTEPVKTDVATNYFKSKADLSQFPLIRMRLTSLFDGLSDETVLSLSPQAQIEWDGQYDAYKLEDVYSPAPYMATVLYDTIDLSVNALPELVNGVNIPVRVKVDITGTFEMSIQREGQPQIGNCLIMEDLDNGKVIDLKTDTFYSFTMPDSVTTPRFLIHGNPRVDLGRDTLLRPGAQLTLDPGSGQGQYIWSTGSTQPRILVSDTGWYSVDFTDRFGCSATDSVWIGLDTSRTGLDQVNPYSGLVNIYPNPANEGLFIDMSEWSGGVIDLTVFDISGALIMNKSFDADQEGNQLRLDVSNYASGSYTLGLNGQNGPIFKRFTVVH